MANQKNDSYGINADGFAENFFGLGQQHGQGPTILMEYDVDHPEEILGKTHFKTEAEAQRAAALVTMAIQFGCKDTKRALSYDLIARNSVNQQGRLQYMQCYTMSFNADLYKDNAKTEKKGFLGFGKKDKKEEDSE